VRAWGDCGLDLKAGELTPRARDVYRIGIDEGRPFQVPIGNSRPGQCSRIEKG